MQTFSMPPLPADAPQWMRMWVAQVDAAIKQAANAANNNVGANYLNVAPIRPQNGVYLADGTNWNPGSGRGTYRYDSTAATYTFLG